MDRTFSRNPIRWFYPIVVPTLLLFALLLPTTPLFAQVDVEISLSAPVRATPGEEFTYTLTVTNHTGKKLTQIEVKDTLPAMTTFVTASDGGELGEYDTVHWQKLPDLDDGEVLLLQLVVRVQDDATEKIVNSIYSVNYKGAPIERFGGKEIKTRILAPEQMPADADPYPDLVIFEDLNGAFTIDLPLYFTQNSELGYGDVAFNPLPGLQADYGYFFHSDEPNDGALMVFFLKMEHEISSEAAWAEFLPSFTQSFGGDKLANLPLATVWARGEPSVEIEKETDEAHVLMRLHATGNNLIAMLATAPLTTWSEHRSDLLGALDRFEPWTIGYESLLFQRAANTSNQAAAAEEPTPAAEPSSETPANNEPTVEEPAATGVSEISFQKFADTEGLFSVEIPNWPSTTISEPDQGSYGFSFADPERSGEAGDTISPLSISLIDAYKLVDPNWQSLVLQTLDEEEWQQALATLQSRFEPLGTVTLAATDPAQHHALLQVVANQDEGSGNSLLWVEEEEGVAAVILWTEGKDRSMTSTDPNFDRVVRTFSWQPKAARAHLLAQAGYLPTNYGFYDPLSLLTFYPPSAYPFRRVQVIDETVDYGFGSDPAQGVITIQLTSVAKRSLKTKEMAEIVAAAEESLLEGVKENKRDRSAKLIEPEWAVPTVEEGQIALVRAHSKKFEGAVMLHELDGVLATVTLFLPAEQWQANIASLQAALINPPGFEPDIVRQAIADHKSASTATFTVFRGDDPSAGGFHFSPDEPINFFVQLPDNQAEGELEVLVYNPAFERSDPLAMLALLNVSLHNGAADQSEFYTVERGDDGLRATLHYQSDLPQATLPDLRAEFRYNDQWLGEVAFAVQYPEPVTLSDLNFSVVAAAVDAESGHPLDPPQPIVNFVKDNQQVWLNFTGNLPAGSQVRLFREEGLLDLATAQVETWRPESDLRNAFDFRYFGPYQLPVGDHRFYLTVNGLEVWSQIIHCEVADAFADSTEFFADIDQPQWASDLVDTLAAEGDTLFSLPEDLTAIESESADAAFSTAALSQEVFDRFGRMLTTFGATRIQPASWAAQFNGQQRRWRVGDSQIVLQLTEESDSDNKPIYLLEVEPANSEFLSALPADEPISAATVKRLAPLVTWGFSDVHFDEGALSPDGDWVALVTSEGQLYLFDAHTLDMVRSQPLPPLTHTRYRAPIFSNDSQWLALIVESEHGDYIQLWHNWDAIWSWQADLLGHIGTIVNLRFADDASTLYSAAQDGTLRQWQIQALNATSTPIWLDDQPAAISDTAIAADGQIGALALANGTLMLLNEKGDVQVQYELNEQNPQIRFRPDANRRQGVLLIQAEDHVRLLRYRGKRIEDLGQIPAAGEEMALHDAAFSPDASLLLLAGDELSFYDSETGDWLGNLPITSGENDVVANQVSFSMDGKWLLVISAEPGEASLYAITVK
ncbi:MAG: hypothetical protein U0175_31690 [Caldilineaceae bacterium]